LNHGWKGVRSKQKAKSAAYRAFEKSESGRRELPAIKGREGISKEFAVS
jgi:hypothetical protein